MKIRNHTAWALVGFKQAAHKMLSRCHFHSANPNIYAAKLVLCISGSNQVFWQKIDFKSLQQFQSTLWNGLPYFLATAGITQKWTLFFFLCIGSLILAIIINYNGVKFEEKSETCCWHFSWSDFPPAFDIICSCIF